MHDTKRYKRIKLLSLILICEDREFAKGEYSLRQSGIRSNKPRLETLGNISDNILVRRYVDELAGREEVRCKRDLV